MMDMPSLILPSVFASIALSLFLAFWVAVIVCLATANYPGMKPFLKQTPSNITELSVAEVPSLQIRNNTGDDYKSFTLIEYHEADLLQNMLWFYIIGLIWTCEFIFGELIRHWQLMVAFVCF